MNAALRSVLIGRKVNEFPDKNTEHKAIPKPPGVYYSSSALEMWEWWKQQQEESSAPQISLFLQRHWKSWASEQVSRGGSSLSHGVKTDQPWLTGPHTAHQHHLMVVEVNKSQYSYKNLFLKHKLVSFLVVLTSWAMLTARLVVIYMVCKLDKTFTQYYVNLTQLCEIFSRCLDMNHRHITLISRVRRSYRVQITWLTYKSVMKNSAAITAVHFLRWFGWFIRTSSVFFFFKSIFQLWPIFFRTKCT